MPIDDFFAQQKVHSRIKAAIVGEYFDVWANVILPTVKRRNSLMSYVDLFAGKGRYDDGEPSTPLIILKKAIAHPGLRKHLTTEFNDADPATAAALREAVANLPGIDILEHSPKITSYEVSQDTVDRFKYGRLHPTLLFADPFGFKGLSLQLIKATLSNWGCDCIFFFNFNSINRWITAEIVKDHIDRLFGIDGADELRAILPSLPPAQREARIVDTLRNSIKALTYRLFIPSRSKMLGATEQATTSFWPLKAYLDTLDLRTLRRHTVQHRHKALHLSDLIRIRTLRRASFSNPQSTIWKQCCWIASLERRSPSGIFMTAIALIDRTVCQTIGEPSVT
jgi:three-Cys-motif partner protein